MKFEIIGGPFKGMIAEGKVLCEWETPVIINDASYTDTEIIIQNKYLKTYVPLPRRQSIKVKGRDGKWRHK